MAPQRVPSLKRNLGGERNHGPGNLRLNMMRSEPRRCAGVPPPAARTAVCGCSFGRRRHRHRDCRRLELAVYYAAAIADRTAVRPGSTVRAALGASMPAARKDRRI